MTADRTRNALINRISAVGLCVHEAALFLDTHPTDRDALEFFRMRRNELCALVKEYENKYGPMTAFADPADGSWSWTDGPWPWQNECMCSGRAR